MLFNSLSFFVFFPIVVCVYFMVPHRFRWFILLLASCFFYAALVPKYLFILFALIIVDFVCAILIENSSGEHKKYYLSLSIVCTCLILFVFKYYNFFASNVNSVLSITGKDHSLPLLTLLLPIGLSFHTFQSLSYVIEVYRGRQKAERHPGIYALYVMFFPQLVAGPIERPQNLLHQFYEKKTIEYGRFSFGCRQMLLGYFKKMVIADNLAPYVHTVYSDTAHASGNMIVMAVIFFSIQIYCDFSGYSDIAIGSARIMGFDLTHNFYFPYFSTSVTEFWRRWHISLSQWFRDYIYFPLGGSRHKSYRNIVIVFLLSALWHGAGWTFIVWGALHALYILLDRWLFSPLLKLCGADKKVINVIGGVLTFLLVSFAWIFFRAKDMNNALAVISHISLQPANFIIDFATLAARVQILFPCHVAFIYVLVSLILFVTTEVILYKREQAIEHLSTSRIVRWGLYYAAIASILLFGVYDVTPNFIYFQF